MDGASSISSLACDDDDDDDDDGNVYCDDFPLAMPLLSLSSTLPASFGERSVLFSTTEYSQQNLLLQIDPPVAQVVQLSEAF